MNGGRAAEAFAEAAPDLYSELMSANEYARFYLMAAATGWLGSAGVAARPGENPAPPLGPSCMPPCNPLYGTCNPDCTITCDSGHLNCGDVSKGCDCVPSDTCHVATCQAGSCKQTITNVGFSCASDCVLNGTCDPTGTCHGLPAADGSICNASNCADPVGSCVHGVCTCSHPIGNGDMGMKAQGGGSCSLGASDGAAGAGTLLLLGGYAAIVLRRRRRQSRPLRAAPPGR
jgi:hypothetical protein